MKINNRTFCFLALLLAGCIPSIHPLYNEKTLIFKEELIGKWTADDGGFWQFRKAGEKEYELRVFDFDKEKVIGSFSAHLIEIEGLMFLDLYPSSDTLEDMDDLSKMHHLPVHTFMKVDQIDPNLQLRMIDYEELGEILENDPNSLKHEIVDDHIVLTAGTLELQNFLIKHIETIFEDTSDDEDSDLIRLKPLYTEQNIITDPNFVGKWKTEDEDILYSKMTDEKMYELTYIGADGTKHEIFANLIRHNNNMFLAMFFDKDELDPKKPNAYAFHLVPDMFFKVRMTKSELTLQDIEYHQAHQNLHDNISQEKQQQPDDTYIFRGTRIEP